MKSDKVLQGLQLAKRRGESGGAQGQGPAHVRLQREGDGVPAMRGAVGGGSQGQAGERGLRAPDGERQLPD